MGRSGRVRAGSQISTVAYPLLVLALTHSPAKAGLVGLAATLPLPLLALPAGMLADHFDRKHLMLACDAIRAAALAALTIAVFAGHVAFGVIAAVAFIDGALMTVPFVTERGVLRRLVPPEQLSAAVAQNESVFYASSILGPPVGGLLFAIARAVPFLADSVSYAFSAAAKLLTRAQFQVERTQERGNLAAEFTSGLRWLWRQPLLRTCSLLTAAANPTWRALYLMLVVLAKRHGASSTLVGVMFAMIAAGGLLGGFLAGSRFADRISARAAVRFDICVTALLMPLLLIAQDAVHRPDRGADRGPGPDREFPDRGPTRNAGPRVHAGSGPRRRRHTFPVPGLGRTVGDRLGPRALLEYDEHPHALRMGAAIGAGGTAAA